jgi:glutamate N-acetyltransferase/amino-acid N-acetyltransferase
MLAPALATMLSVVMTDAVLPDIAQEIFQRVCDRTYNRIDSDGCTSTNDTVLLMGSGASGYAPSASELEEALMQVCGSLSQQLIADAEGSTKTVAIEIKNAASESDAVEVARVEANRPLWINTNVAHRPETHHDKLRLAASIRFYPEPLDEKGELWPHLVKE